MKRWISLLALVVFVALPACDVPTDPAVAPEDVCLVSASVADGDTLTCQDGRKIRLLSIDAPEMSQSPFGALAREQLRSLAPTGARLSVELDQEQTDRYGRTLAYVYSADGQMVNLQMAQRGYAVDLVYSPNTRYAASIRSAVAQARASRRGLWGMNGFACLPVDHRADRC